MPFLSLSPLSSLARSLDSSFKILLLFFSFFLFSLPTVESNTWTVGVFLIYLLHLLILHIMARERRRRRTERANEQTKRARDGLLITIVENFCFFFIFSDRMLLLCPHRTMMRLLLYCIKSLSRPFCAALLDWTLLLAPTSWAKKEREKKNAHPTLLFHVLCCCCCCPCPH